MNIKATLALAAGVAVSACQQAPDFLRHENDVARDLVKKELSLRGERAEPTIKYPYGKGIINLTEITRSLMNPGEVCAKYLVELDSRPRGANEDQYTCARSFRVPTVYRR